MGWGLAFAQQGLPPCKKKSLTKNNAEFAWRTNELFTCLPRFDPKHFDIETNRDKLPDITRLLDHP